jgi:hypothetical protein
MSVGAFSDWDEKMYGGDEQLRGEKYVCSGVSERIPTLANGINRV